MHEGWLVPYALEQVADTTILGSRQKQSRMYTYIMYQGETIAQAISDDTFWNSNNTRLSEGDVVLVYSPKEACFIYMKVSYSYAGKNILEVIKDKACADDKAIKEWVLEQLKGYQELLTFDDTPTEGSTNPVTSGGIHDALEGNKGCIRELHFDGSYVAEESAIWFFPYKGTKWSDIESGKEYLIYLNLDNKIDKPDDTVFWIVKDQDKSDYIAIRNVKQVSSTSTWGDLSQVLDNGNKNGKRWVFKAIFKGADETTEYGKAFGIISTIVNIPDDVGTKVIFRDWSV